MDTVEQYESYEDYLDSQVKAFCSSNGACIMLRGRLSWSRQLVPM